MSCDIRAMAMAAREAARQLATASGVARAKALDAMAAKLEGVKAELMAANAEDIAAAKAAGCNEAFLKRLTVNEKIFNYMAKRLREAAALPDPVGRILEGRTMPSGLQVSRISVPLGVVGIIYEARPNVTTDAAAVALKSANAVILKGGSESIRTNRILVQAMKSAIVEAGLPENAVQFIDSTEHQAVTELLQQDKYVDVLIPRGGKSLIKAVSEGTRIPVIKHYDGICHQYVASDADIDMAVKVVLNSKTERVEVCNALETLLVDAAIAEKFLPPMA
ncbi:MAG: glutamate-5-semialdehyde dehydrogenase, partial [Victivallales bacterium]|nr:glutamate-5-semialdehyde dehydrogenase [Victivallales bacterium]